MLKQIKTLHKDLNVFLTSLFSVLDSFVEFFFPCFFVLTVDLSLCRNVLPYLRGMFSCFSHFEQRLSMLHKISSLIKKGGWADK